MFSQNPGVATLAVAVVIMDRAKLPHIHMQHITFPILLLSITSFYYMKNGLLPWSHQSPYSAGYLIQHALHTVVKYAVP